VAIGEGFPDVLVAAQAGDPAALTTIYRDVSPLVLGYLRSNRVVDAEDVAGDVFVSLVQKISSFQGTEHQFRSWLLTITHRRMVDHIRREVRAPEPTPIDERAHVSTSEPPSTEREALANLASHELTAAMDALSPLQRSVVMLRVLADLTVPEIARVMDKPESAVKALLRRAVANLSRAAKGDAVDDRRSS
jgi:RNA polymerase sigma factor (sigma-70 family)